ncbi:PREDICTED: condensin-2 complex subunit H2 [Condylura cristata]|uniref:condensin-2 complex subunit H2 n=1 Tax=Condylura cristata TaxID=143302 RepID=UPI000642D211|nr:PREDICTED: condensin-2 complex subunit H2 [Condylura cristata]
MALVAPDEAEKSSSPLYSCQGEVLASRKDFRMNTCTPHPRGAFMLEPVGMSPEDALLPPSQKGEGATGDRRGPADPRPAPEAPGSEEQPMDVSLCGGVAPVASLCQEPGPSPEGWLPGGGGEEEAEAPLECEEPRSPPQSEQPQRYVLRERAAALPPPQDAPDPWQSLDPFDSLDSKPFRKGRPYSVPPCAEEAPGQKRKRKGASRLQDFHQWCLAAYADHADGRRPRRKGPSFADMEVLYWRHVREQLEALRRLQRREVAERWLPRAEEGLWPVEDERLGDPLEDLGAADDLLEPEESPEPARMRPEEARAL